MFPDLPTDGINECWIVDPQNRAVTIYGMIRNKKLPQPGVYQGSFRKCRSCLSGSKEVYMFENREFSGRPEPGFPGLLRVSQTLVRTDRAVEADVAAEIATFRAE